ncbi:MAG: MotA/TolQ/ExbB proton channel family protein, partial [Gemmobacter sp.]
MIHLIDARNAILALIDLGGWVVALILGLSVIAGAVVLVKLWQFRAAGVGRHDGLMAAMAASDAGAAARALALAEAAPSHLGALLARALRAPDARERLY